MDTRPNWDDTGVTAGAVLIVSLAGAVAGVPLLLAAALCAGPILCAELGKGTGVLLTVPIALAAACIGAFARTKVRGEE
jgi:hypothetical protein